MRDGEEFVLDLVGLGSARFQRVGLLRHQRERTGNVAAGSGAEAGAERQDAAKLDMQLAQICGEGRALHRSAPQVGVEAAQMVQLLGAIERAEDD